MVRGLVLGALAFGAVFIADRQFAGFAKDIKRYDAMRQMSGDPPFLSEVLKTVKTAISDFGASRQGGARNLFASLAHDVMRYATMRSM